MAKKRTRKQKQSATHRHVNTQFVYNFKPSSKKKSKVKNANITENSEDLGSIKKDLFNSLTISFLIMVSLVMVYWFS